MINKTKFAWWLFVSNIFTIIVCLCLHTTGIWQIFWVIPALMIVCAFCEFMWWVYRNWDKEEK